MKRWLTPLLVPLALIACARAPHKPPAPIGWEQAIEVQRGVIDTQAVWDDNAAVKRSPAIPELLRYEDLEAFLQNLPPDFDDEVLIETEEGRAIHHLTYGHGDTPVLIWARQHGDEDICSSALMDVIGYLIDRQDTPLVQAIQNNLTLHIVPLVNPDGAEAFTRRNAQDIDPNRDARLRQSSSGRALRMMFERYRPEVCFNLHDQQPRKSTDDTGDLIALSLQACPYDRAETPGPQLQRAKRICSLIENSLQPWIGGHIARYEADYMPRAFGDSMSRWGVASILIESGGWFGTPRESDEYITKCHYLALLSGLAAVASGAEEGGIASAYDDLPLEGRSHVDLLVRDALIADGTDVTPHLGDLGINRQVDYRHGGEWSGFIRDVGDLSILRGRNVIAAENLVATPGLVMYHPFQIEQEDMEDALRRGVTTLVSESNDATISPNEETPLRIIRFERVRDLDDAASRHFMTNAHGMIVPLHCFLPSDLANQVPELEGVNTGCNVDLVLINRGRSDQNQAVLLLQPHLPDLQSSAPDLTSIRDFFPKIDVAVVGEDGIMSMLPSDDGKQILATWPPRIAPTPDLARFTTDLANALVLPWNVALRNGGDGDAVLWQTETGDDGQTRLVAPVYVVVAGQVVDIE